jgi:hypothetical protein
MPFGPQALLSEALFGRPGDVFHDCGYEFAPAILHKIDASIGRHLLEEGEEERVGIGRLLF